jgi:FAD/FMN-containing dehydrogenase
MQPAIDALAKAGFQGDIAGDDATLTSHSKDASLFIVRPKLVVFPKNVEDVKRLVKWAEEERQKDLTFSLTARSAGTDMSGGPLTSSVSVDFTRYFNHIIEVGSGSGDGGYCITEPGVYYRDFDKATKAKNLILPCYPASRELCTVGGMISNNSGGEKTLLYGKTEDYILEMSMVLRDGNEYTFEPITLAELEEKKKLQTMEGEIYRDLSDLVMKNDDLLKKAKPPVSKNSAGYYLWNVLDKEKGIFDITKVLVGSQGTFGFVTKMKYRLVRPHIHSRLLVVFLKDMKQLGEITNHLLQFKPESLESYDDHTFKLAVKLFPVMVKQMKSNLIKVGFQFLPEFWAVLTGGMPKLVLMAEFTADTDAAALDAATKAQASVQEFKSQFSSSSRITQSPQEVQKYWTIRRESFNMLRQHVKGLRTAPFIDDLVVDPKYLPEFLPKLYEILDKYPITYTIAGHVGNGNFHIIPLMDLHNPHSKEIIEKLAEIVNTLVFQYHGSITGEHNDGLIRSGFLKQMYGPEIYALFEQTKKIFDPAGIFNPGKKVGVTWQEALTKVDTSIAK